MAEAANSASPASTASFQAKWSASFAPSLVPRVVRYINNPREPRVPQLRSDDRFPREAARLSAAHHAHVLPARSLTGRRVQFLGHGKGLAGGYLRRPRNGDEGGGNGSMC